MLAAYALRYIYVIICGVSEGPEYIVSQSYDGYLASRRSILMTMIIRLKVKLATLIVWMYVKNKIAKADTFLGDGLSPASSRCQRIVVCEL